MPLRRQLLALIVAVAAGLAWCGATPHVAAAFGAVGGQSGMVGAATLPVSGGGAHHVTCCDDARVRTEIAVVTAEWSPPPAVQTAQGTQTLQPEAIRTILPDPAGNPSLPPITLHHLAVLLLI